MSILLDSLKKSEAQRVMGDAPSIYSDGYDSHPSRPSHGWLFWLMLGLSAAAITWFGWRQYAPPEASDAELARIVPLEDHEPALEGAPALTKPSLSGATRNRERTADDGADTDPPEDPLPLPRRPQSSNSTSAPSTDGSWSLLSRSVATYTPPDTQDIVTDEEYPADDEYLAEEEAFASVEEALDPEPEPEPFDSERFVVVPGTSPISYWSLPQSVRNALPEFRITVLVYAEQPADRFVLMNGERYREQDAPESGLILEEIRREGVIFTYRNYRFLVSN